MQLIASFGESEVSSNILTISKFTAIGSTYQFSYGNPSFATFFITYLYPNSVNIL